MKRRLSHGLAVVLFVVAGAACGPTQQEVLDGHGEEFAAMRATLLTIHGGLPPKDRATDDRGLAGLDPVPAYDEEVESGNVEILMDWQLPDPDAKARDRMDLLLGGPLLLYLQWTGPDRSSPLNNSADDSFRKEIVAALATPYLVVVRETAFDAPRVDLEKSEYYGGRVVMEAFLFDLPAEKLLGSFRFEAVPEGDIEYVYTEGGADQQERAEAWARSKVWSTAREKLCALLSEKSGGEFKAD